MVAPEATAYDYTSFPHIFDAIFADCDTPTTIAFRGVSRAFRDAVDDALLTHVALCAVPAPASQATIGTGGTILGFVRPSELADPKPLPPDPESTDLTTALALLPPGFLQSFDSLHVDPQGKGTKTTRTPAAPPPLLPRVPAVIRTLDLTRGFMYNFNGLANLRTLRRAGFGVQFLPPSLESLTTVVDFATPSDMLPCRGTPLVVPTGLDKYILHVRWDQWPQEERYGLNTSIIGSHGTAPREMVLVLRPYLSGYRLDFFRGTAVGMLAVLEADGKVCIVGAEQLPIPNIGEEQGADGPDPHKWFKTIIRFFWPGHEADRERLDALLAQIESITVTEWHARLKAEGRGKDGLDSYEMQAVWPGYAHEHTSFMTETSCDCLRCQTDS
ncbi:hypothetical protein Q8F55_000065 [Vanrija albida]|uniref:F-box domain-containing protein n=1 Tax=Vanrija albida TaxID=181172 RepID=A0ABR3QD78_9TREE